MLSVSFVHAGLRSRCSCGCHQLDSILGGQECKSFRLEVFLLLLKKVTPAAILLQIVMLITRIIAAKFKIH